MVRQRLNCGWTMLCACSHAMPDQEPTPTPKKEDLSSARLGSVAVECNKLKDEYEQCFFDFFPRFLCGEKFKEDPCASQFEAYRQCLRRHLSGHMGVDLDKLDAQHMSAAEMAEAMAQGTSRKS
ncbi:Mitochondrial distribution morphology family 35 apoptosis [Echinococcus multilocularis]|uniref:Mitochondrial distribution morphology family 35 apoptosis n=1 Tax=Echinococcus multilocularis TaxID=6211 RepID=A0A068YFT2_ECHMU|nr:Mitochondrial distribution morphology family 35 apoptosis [Echinococcus multilocularis]